METIGGKGIRVELIAEGDQVCVYILFPDGRIVILSQREAINLWDDVGEAIDLILEGVDLDDLRVKTREMLGERKIKGKRWKYRRIRRIKGAG